ncbi:aspartic proteinase 36-like isoform X1 [Bidens hawaiensis]|uniref:aspartic proteinase 36-like isoform X1 n=1 Tax=Bidens hawaiensis TaxID=980011 RepID=UPI00404A3CCB
MSCVDVVLFFFFFLILTISLLSVSSSSPINILRPSIAGNNRHTMFLPLYPSSLNSSADGISRRQLKATSRPNARMALHDDLLLNGYYTTRLWIGSPPQRFALIVDTGSTVTYVPCSTCQQCGKHQDPKFDPESSDTYKPVKCNVDCTCDDKREQCIYERQYAEMSSSSGVLGEDIVSFGNQSDLPPQHAVFGCENRETGDLFSQHADGIMGLGRGDLSIVDQLVDSRVISDSFSLCYGGMDVGGGAMVLGGIDPPNEMVYSYSDPVRSPYYNIELKELHVAGKRLALSSSVFDGKHGTVLDSGTTYAYLPEAAFVAFRDAVMKEVVGLHQIKGPDPSYNDICFAGAGSDVLQLSKAFPSVEMVFGKGHKLSLSPENYLFRHARVSGAYCLGVFQNGNDPTTLLGGIIVRNTFVMYDREHDKIGFWKTNCSHIWETLHVSGGPSPPPSRASTPPNGSNSTSDSDLSPSSSPMMAPQNIPSKSRWPKNYLVAVGASMLALLVGLSGVGLWWFWRQKQQSIIQYKPVDSVVVPEQELQPL